MTMTTIADAIAAVQDVVGAVSGIRFAPDIPPEQWLTRFEINNIPGF